MDDIVLGVRTPELLEGGFDVVLEFGVVPVFAGDAEQMEGIGQDLGGDEIVDGGQEQALGEVAGSSEDGHQRGRDGWGRVRHERGLSWWHTDRPRSLEKRESGSLRDENKDGGRGNHAPAPSAEVS